MTTPEPVKIPQMYFYIPCYPCTDMVYLHDLLILWVDVCKHSMDNLGIVDRVDFSCDNCGGQDDSPLIVNPMEVSEEI